MLKKAQIDYKALNYSLRRIVCNEDESHIVLATGVPNQVDVVKSTNMFFKVNMSGRYSQGRMLIQYAPG